MMGRTCDAEYVHLCDGGSVASMGNTVCNGRTAKMVGADELSYAPCGCVWAHEL